MTDQTYHRAEAEALIPYAGGWGPTEHLLIAIYDLLDERLPKRRLDCARDFMRGRGLWADDTGTYETDPDGRVLTHRTTEGEHKVGECDDCATLTPKQRDFVRWAFNDPIRASCPRGKDCYHCNPPEQDHDGLIWDVFLGGSVEGCRCGTARKNTPDSSQSQAQEPRTGDPGTQGHRDADRAAGDVSGRTVVVYRDDLLTYLDASKGWTGAEDRLRGALGQS